MRVVICFWSMKIRSKGLTVDWSVLTTNWFEWFPTKMINLKRDIKFALTKKEGPNESIVDDLLTNTIEVVMVLKVFEIGITVDNVLLIDSYLIDSHISFLKI